METSDAEAGRAWTSHETVPDGAWTTSKAPRQRVRAVRGGRGELFASVASARRGRSRAWLCLQASLAAHATIAAALVLVPILAPGRSPEPLHAVFGTVFLEPPPPPPPPPASRSDVRVVEQPTPAPVLPDPNAVVAPIPDPMDLLFEPPVADASLEGIEGGVEGGVVGGLPGGVVGGLIGGTGTGPVPEPEPDRQPRALKLSKPRYPPEAFVKRIEGTVELEILIDAQGRVVEARVTRSIPLLDAAAVETVLAWRFSPAIKNGRPVAALARAPVTFRIH